MRGKQIIIIIIIVKGQKVESFAFVSVEILIINLLRVWRHVRFSWTGYIIIEI